MLVNSRMAKRTLSQQMAKTNLKLGTVTYFCIGVLIHKLCLRFRLCIFDNQEIGDCPQFFPTRQTRLGKAKPFPVEANAGPTCPRSTGDRGQVAANAWHTSPAPDQIHAGDGSL